MMARWSHLVKRTCEKPSELPGLAGPYKTKSSRPHRACPEWRGLALEGRYKPEPAGASARSATLRGPHPQPPPPLCVYQGPFQRGRDDEGWRWNVGTSPNQPGLRPAPLRCAVLIPSHLRRSACTKARFNAAVTTRAGVGRSVQARTSRGFGPLRYAARSSSPATSAALRVPRPVSTRP
jgi:hypothetical protein